jgi:AraC family transcriptional regulator, positive regulator of tynA and feaB
MSPRACADGLLPGERAEHWRQVMSRAFVPLDVCSEGPGRLDGELRVEDVGEVAVATLRSTPQRITRTPKLIADSDRELWQVAVVRRGRGWLEQDDRQVRLSAGDLVIYETARPFRWSLPTAWEANVFTMPRAAVALTPAQSRLLTARRLPGSGGMSGVVSRFLRDLADHLDVPGQTPRTQRVLADVTDLVLGLVGEWLTEATPGARSAGHPRGALLVSVYDYIERHLREPDLTPARVAAAHAISPRTLHALFADQPLPVAAHIRTLRLRRCAADLLDPRTAAHSVAAIAAAAGFGDHRGFERAFVRLYGVTPGRYRTERA